MRVEDYALPLADPLATAAGTVESRTGFLVSVGPDDGLEARGVGEAAPLPGWTESVEDCRSALADAADRAASEGLDAAVAGVDPGATPAARHGLALAVLDARARAAGEPLYRHLGAETRVESVPVNATIGDGNVVQTRAAAERAVEAGFTTLKIKVGARDVGTDLERLWAVREACPAAALRVDANGSWDQETARKAVRAGTVQRVSYVEQPLPATDLDGHAALRDRGVGVAVDESVVECGLDAVLDAGAADAVVLKPMALGGPDRAREAAHRAHEAGVVPVVTTTVDGAVARAAAVHVAATLPGAVACGLATGDRLARDLLATDPAPREDGRVRVPQDAGNAPHPEDEPDA
ncbi:MAG: mandelate racemase/muconate lactonizing enzyme family protein [Haloarculaceae archaeon]